MIRPQHKIYLKIAQKKNNNRCFIHLTLEAEIFLPQNEFYLYFIFLLQTFELYLWYDASVNSQRLLIIIITTKFESLQFCSLPSISQKFTYLNQKSNENN